MEMVTTLKHLAHSILFLALFCCTSAGNAAVKFYAQDAQPATCTKGDMWTDTNATTGERIYSCESTNTWVKQKGAGASDNVTFSNVTAAGGTITAGVGGSTQGALVLKSNTDPIYTFGLMPAASPTAIVGIKAPAGMPTANNSLWTVDIDGQSEWTDPASITGSGDDLGSAAYSDVVALWTTCTGYLKSDGTCSTPSGSVPDGTINGQVLQWATDQWVAAALGTASAYNVGTGNNNIVQLNSSGQLPFTLDLMDLTSGGTAISPPGTAGHVLTANTSGVITWAAPSTGATGSDTAYDATSWDANTDVPTKNVVRDKFESLPIPVVSDTAYNASSWDGNSDAATKNAIRDKIETISVAAPTVQSADPTSASAQGWYCATGSGDCFYKSSAGLFALPGTYTADPVTYTLTITDPGNGDKITCSDSDLPTAIDCGDGATDCVISGIAENAVISGITGVADTGREWVDFTGTGFSGATYNAGTVTMSANRIGSATFQSSITYILDEDFTADATGWTLENNSGGGWDSGTGTYLVQNGSYAYVSYTATGLVNGTEYNYSFDVTEISMASGSLSVESPSGTTIRASITTTGTYTGTFTAGAAATVRFIINSGSTPRSARIDNIRIWE